MEALKQLESRILEELNDVQDIQRRLIRNRHLNEQESDDYDSYDYSNNTSIMNTHINTPLVFDKSPKASYMKQKSRFTKNPNTISTPSRNQSVGKENRRDQSIHQGKSPIRQDKKFQPSFHLLKENEGRFVSHKGSNIPKSSYRHNIDHTSNTRRRIDNISKSPNVNKEGKTSVNRRWSMLKYEESNDNTVEDKRHIYESKSEEQDNIEVNNKQFCGHKSPTSPIRNNRSISAAGSAAKNSKYKETPACEYTFRPQLSAKSMLIAKGLVCLCNERKKGLLIDLLK